MAKLCPLFSGSSGNSYYIEASGSGILVDAGRSAKQIENAMRANELDIKRVQAIFVTHEHSDHIKGVRVLASRYHIPVYSSRGTLEGMEEAGALSEKFEAFGGYDTDVAVNKIAAGLSISREMSWK